VPQALDVLSLVMTKVFDTHSLFDCMTKITNSKLIVGRAVAGLGGSGLANGALTIISASVPTDKLPGKLYLPV
jgi:hypothetical protein